MVTYTLPPMPRLVIIPLILLICSLYFARQSYDGNPPPIKIPTLPHGNLSDEMHIFNASMATFWKELIPHLLETKPQCKPIRIMLESAQEDRFDPLDVRKNRLQRLGNMTKDSEIALFRSHYKARRLSQYLAPKMPIFQRRTGIVATIVPEDMAAFLVSLRMLRRTGCSLPMEVFFTEWNHYDSHFCNVLLSSLHASCVVLSDLYNTNATAINNSNPAQNKILSVLFSTFEHVLYLDTGAFPTYDPTILFSVPPYTSHGLVTWPDFTAVPASDHFYHIAGIPPEPTFFRPSTSGGQILINKGLHRESVLLMLYYAFYGPNYFFPLLCQTTHPSCFKELFSHAAQIVRLPWYQVRTAPHSLGRWLNGTYRNIGTASADPGLDFEYLPNFPSHLHPDPHWLKEDLAHPNDTIEKKLNFTRHAPASPRPVFLYQQNLRLDPSTVLANKSQVVYETDGVPHRMWGNKDDIVRLVGYDVERRVWDVVAHEACREDQGADMCKDVIEWVREVCGWMDSIDRPW